MASSIDSRTNFGCELHGRPNYGGAELFFALAAAFPPQIRPTMIGESAEERGEELVLSEENRPCIERLSKKRSMLYLQGRLVSISVHLLSDAHCWLDVYSQEPQLPWAIERWLRNQTGLTLQYGWAADSEEHDYCNGYSIPLAENPLGRPMHGWIGRDYQRYLPGLYWLNVLSAEYIAVQKLEPLLAEIAPRQEPVDGLLILKLYEHPSDWKRQRPKLDAISERYSEVFSRCRVELPHEIGIRDVPSLIRRLGKECP